MTPVFGNSWRGLPLVIHDMALRRAQWKGGQPMTTTATEPSKATKQKQSPSRAKPRKKPVEATAKRVVKTAKKEAEQTATLIIDKAHEVARDNVQQAASSVQTEAHGFGAALSRAVKAGAGELESAGYTSVASYASRLGESADGVSEAIDNYDIDKLISGASSAMAKRPAVTITALALVGFAGALALSQLNKNNK
jgi:NADH dehydrogenase/NADH:ubiquinone oxidoreductase subunit G